MGRTVGHWFHLNHEEFYGHRLRKKRSDPDFSVQTMDDGHIHGCQLTVLPGIFPDEEVWRLLSVITENNILKEESQLLPNHHIATSTRYVIPKLESQLLPNGSLWDGARYDWVELESQLLPNRHIMNVAKYIASKLESQLLPSGDMEYMSLNLSRGRYDWVELVYELLPNRHIMNVVKYIASKLESQLLPNASGDMKYTALNLSRKSLNLSYYQKCLLLRL